MHLSCLFVYILIFIAYGMDVNVQTKYGAVKGYLSPTHNIWKGIPYADAPVGDLRWKMPQPPKSWTGVKNTLAPSKACPQPGVTEISEDCLYLNIFTPVGASASSKLPVYIFIHGGSFYGGSGGGVDGEYLSGTDIVFVSINYRLGAFGYLALPELLNGTNTYGFYGIQDQRAAFQWVKDNIAAFGGNPNQITIGGQSAGAMSVCIHVAALRSGGLFQKGIMESGTCVISSTTSTVQESQNLAKSLGCNEGPGIVGCMKSKSMESIVANTHGPIWPCPNPLEMDKQPIDMIREGKYNQVDLIAGTCHDEQSFEACPWYGTTNATTYPENMNRIFGSHIGPLATKLYPVQDYEPPVAGLVASWSDMRFKCPTLFMLEAMQPVQTQKVYMYSFERIPSWQKNKCLNVTHSTELAFLYPGHGNFTYGTPEEQVLSKTMQEYWTSFIITGTPRSETSDVVWQPFVNATQPYMVLNVPHVEMEQHFREPYCKFMATYIPG